MINTLEHYRPRYTLQCKVCTHIQYLSTYTIPQTALCFVAFGSYFSSSYNLVDRISFRSNLDQIYIKFIIKICHTKSCFFCSLLANKVKTTLRKLLQFLRTFFTAKTPDIPFNICCRFFLAKIPTSWFKSLFQVKQQNYLLSLAYRVLISHDCQTFTFSFCFSFCFLFCFSFFLFY